MGNPESRDAALSAYASSLIKFKAQQLDRKRALHGMSSDDIAQELRARLLAEAHRFDPERGASFDTFANRIINTAIASLLRDQKRKKRAGESHNVSLDQPGKGGKEESATLGGQLSDADRIRHTGVTRPDRAEEILAEVESWPEQDRQLFFDLLENTVAAVARARGITRQRVYRLMEHMRKRFESADLEP